MKKITTIEELDELYGAPSDRAIIKEASYLTDHYQTFIRQSPF